ncbi:unnamed protein product, partial [Pylaiella littoralis]
YCSPVPPPSLGQRRRRASWSSSRDSRYLGGFAVNQSADGEGSSYAAKVPPPLQMRWEMQGVSGRAYQKDGDLSLYRKKKLAARRRLSKHNGVRAAIERGWWPYLPLRWVVLNDKEVLKVLPKQAYNDLFAAMYATLVPTAGKAESEETANWEYSADAQGLPPALRRVGITRGVFSAALFAVADNWTETVLAKDYIEFLDLLWKRVRPDLLFPPPPPPEGEKRPPLFSTATVKGSGKGLGEKSKKNWKGRRNGRRNDHGSVSRRRQSPTENAIDNADGARDGVGELLGRYYSRPFTPPPVPLPSTVEGLVLLHIPGFRPEEARRAPWVLKGGLIDPTVGQALGLETDLAGADGGGVHHRGREMGEGNGARAGQEQKQTTGVKQPSWKGRRRERLLASGVVEEREVFRDPTGDRGCEEERGMEAMDSIQNFLSVNFPDVPREGDAFALFAERKLPRLLNNNTTSTTTITKNNSPEAQAALDRSISVRFDNAAADAERPAPGAGADPPVVRLYRSDEENSARRRRKNVPTRILDDLLEAWRGGEEGMTPAEYGAAFVGPPERASFLAYAISNGWGTRTGGVHSPQTLDAVAEAWRLGRGRCPESEVLWEILEDLLWEEADDAVDDAFSEVVDLYSIPHRLLHDLPQAQGRAQSGRALRPSLRQQHGDHRRRASTAPASRTTPIATRPGTGNARAARNGGKVVADISGGDGRGGCGWAASSSIDGGTGSAGLAGRVLLQGEKVAGSIRQGKVAYFSAPCPTERGACLEVTLVSEGRVDVGGGRSSNAPTAPTVVSLYAVQAPHRPLRLSSYPWASRGKTHHRLFLHWKGPSSPPPWAGGGTRNTPANPLTGACLPWERDHGYPNPSGASASIYIAVACPEPEPPPPPPAPPAPAFDRIDIGGSLEREHAEVGGVETGGGSHRGPIGSGRGQESMRKTRRRVKFTVGVRLVGPPRVVLEGRWYSLRLGRDTGAGTNNQHPVVYATVRLPTPLMVTRWGPHTGREDPVEGEGSILEGFGEGESGQVLVTLQVRPSDPKDCVDVYCGVSPRPGSNPADHACWMAAGEGNGTPYKAVKIPPHPTTNIETVSEDDEEARRSSSTRSLCDAASDDTAAPNKLISIKGGAAEAGGAGWRRMTVAMPKEHTGAFHVGVFGRDRWSTSVGSAPREGTISLKASIQQAVTRAIDDPLVLRQLKFAQDFQKRFCATGDDDERIPVSEAGRDCQAVHTDPFLLASRRISPEQTEFTWRGENVEGTIEVFRSEDGTEQVFTRYKETLKV